MTTTTAISDRVANVPIYNYQRHHAAKNYEDFLYQLGSPITQLPNDFNLGRKAEAKHDKEMVPDDLPTSAYAG